jgi:hypothetical protein
MRFHGFSVDNLIESISAARYKGLELSKSVLEIGFKTSKSGTFKIATFQFIETLDAENEAWAKLEIENGDNIFDQATASKGFESVLMYNYCGEVKF